MTDQPTPEQSAPDGGAAAGAIPAPERASGPQTERAAVPEEPPPDQGTAAPYPQAPQPDQGTIPQPTTEQPSATPAAPGADLGEEDGE